MVSASDSKSGDSGFCRIRLWPRARLVPGRPEFKSSAMLVNSQLVFVFSFLSGVPVN